MKGLKGLCAVLLTALLILPGGAGSGSAGAETVPAAGQPAIEDWFEEKGLTLGKSSVAYPSLREGKTEEALREEINARILEDGRITEYVTRISQLISGGSLRVGWRGDLLGPVFSFAVFADGAVETPRSTYVWTAGNIDLRDGHEITREELFTDPEGAAEAMEAYLEEEVAPGLSAHLLNSQLTPAPESFRMSERGLILLYPVDQLSTLSDRAGDVLVPWRVVRDQLDLSEDGILSAMGIARWLAADGDDPGALPAESAGALRAMTADGRIPGIPLRLGDRVAERVEEWRLLTDPDVYAGGRFFALEGAPFRGVFLMTDFLTEDWENSVVDGIRTDLGSVCGLNIGETARDAWRAALGEPDYTITADEEWAEAYRTVPGERDYYAFGGHRLQLHANEEGILTSVIISE